MKRLVTTLIFLAGLVCVDASASQDALNQAMDLELKTQRAARTSQQTVERLDDESRKMLEEYRRLSQQLERTRRENDELQAEVERQAQEITRIDTELDEIERLRDDLDPLMLNMLQALKQLVALDTPFLAEERQTRVSALETQFDNRDGTISERFRRLLEAYQIEVDYGRNIEAYEGERVTPDGSRLVVDYLRLGRVGFFYKSLDGQEGGVWDNRQRVWRPLGKEYLAGLDKAIRIARKQMPPDLLELPLWLPGEPGA
jgi:DNA repair exonuclease SbcCD ATPase subunit